MVRLARRLNGLRKKAGAKGSGATPPAIEGTEKTKNLLFFPHRNRKGGLTSVQVQYCSSTFAAQIDKPFRLALTGPKKNGGSESAPLASL